MKSIVLFASGNGTNVQKIIDHFKKSPIAGVKMIFTNNHKAGVINIAKAEDVPIIIINREDFFSTNKYIQLLKKEEPDLIVLAGFLWKIPPAMVAAFPDKIINIHPALLPKYGGKGMYGSPVHQAVIKAGEKESGITIHYVNENYDEGQIILQKSCPIKKEDTAEQLAQKVQQLEHHYYPDTIENILLGK